MKLLEEGDFWRHDWRLLEHGEFESSNEGCSNVSSYGKSEAYTSKEKQIAIINPSIAISIESLRSGNVMFYEYLLYTCILGIVNLKPVYFPFTLPPTVKELKHKCEGIYKNNEHQFACP